MQYKNFIEALKEFAEDHGFDLHLNYSGRGMYGKTCIGIVVPNMKSIIDFFFDFGWCAHKAGVSWEYPTDLTTDNMGHDTIVYWPSCKGE